MNKSTIALCLPAYNTKPFILDCIDSILGASVPDPFVLDLRIGVDGDPELSEFLTRNNIPHYYNLFNDGVGIMRNSLMNLRPCEVYVSFDSDDLMKPDFFVTNLSHITDHPIIRPYKENFRDDKPKISTPFPHGGCFIADRNTLRSFGGYAPTRLHEDTDLFLRIEAEGTEIFYPSGPSTWLRRRHEASTTRDPKILVKGSIRQHQFGIHLAQELEFYRQRVSQYIFPFTTYLQPRAGAKEAAL